jgi:hypothetical protein
LLSFRGIDTPSLAAQGEQRRLSLFNIRRDNSANTVGTGMAVGSAALSSLCVVAITFVDYPWFAAAGFVATYMLF